MKNLNLSNIEITIDVDSCGEEANEFKTWLESKGANVEFGLTNNAYNELGEELGNEYTNNLWNKYCK